MKKPFFPKKPGKSKDEPEKITRRPGKTIQCLYGPPTLLQPIKPKKLDDDEDHKTKM